MYQALAYKHFYRLINSLTVTTLLSSLFTSGKTEQKDIVIGLRSHSLRQMAEPGFEPRKHSTAFVFQSLGPACTESADQKGGPQPLVNKSKNCAEERHRTL